MTVRRRAWALDAAAVGALWLPVPPAGLAAAAPVRAASACPCGGANVERVRGIVDTAFLWHDSDLYRVGLKAAGRLLDGVAHNGVPRA